MSNKKAGEHTQGAFILINTVSGTIYPNEGVFGSKQVAETYKKENLANNSDIVVIANAKLIAAAPKMLKVLEELIEIVDKQCGLNEGGFKAPIDNAKAAINKAKGI